MTVFCYLVCVVLYDYTGVYTTVCNAKVGNWRIQYWRVWLLPHQCRGIQFTVFLSL